KGKAAEGDPSLLWASPLSRDVPFPCPLLLSLRPLLHGFVQFDRWRRRQARQGERTDAREGLQCVQVTPLGCKPLWGPVASPKPPSPVPTSLGSPAEAPFAGTGSRAGKSRLSRVGTPLALRVCPHRGTLLAHPSPERRIPHARPGSHAGGERGAVPRTLRVR